MGNLPKPVDLPIAGPLVPSLFVRRHNRFLLRAELADSKEEVDVHMTDPGRLKELLLPGRRIWLRPASGPNRRTRWSAVLVEEPEKAELVSLDTTLPNRLIRRALEEEALR